MCMYPGKTESKFVECFKKILGKLLISMRKSLILILQDNSLRLFWIPNDGPSRSDYYFVYLFVQLFVFNMICTNAGIVWRVVDLQ